MYMYYPPDFNWKISIELGKLVEQAYQQYECFLQGKPWKIQGGYTLVCEIYYWSLFKTDNGTELTIIDKELQQTNPKLLGREIPMGFLARSDCNAYLVFRGTQTLLERLYDFNTKMEPYLLPNWGKVHEGFLRIYKKCRDRKNFIDSIKGLDKNLNFFITGHSLGAALSILALPDVVSNTSFKHPSLYNFGCPRVGDNTFVTKYNELITPNSFRIVNTSDLVTSVPPPWPEIGGGYYSHVDIPVDFTVQTEDLGGNHSMDTYLNALNEHPKQECPG